jgi:hydrogenase maturation protease
MNARILVAGIGNVFLGDDGFGVEVARSLIETSVPEGVVVMDVGIRSLHLAYALLDSPGLLLVIDAVNRGDPPGTLSLIEPFAAGTPAVSEAEPEIPDAHAMSLDTVLAAVRTLGGRTPPILLLGCEPAFLGERIGLSPTVQNALPKALEMTRAAIARELTIA